MTTPLKSPNSRADRILTVIRDLLMELGSPPKVADHVSLGSSFDRDLGLGSLERVELLVRVEREFNSRLPDEIVQQADTPGEWLQALDGSASERVLSKLRRYPIAQPGTASPAPLSPTSFLDVLRERAERDPSRVQIHLMDGDDGQDISYGQLLERSREVAAGLTSAGLARNETVAIMLPTCEDFFYAFFGIAFAGGIAVPIYPPAQAAKIEEFVTRQTGILRNAGVRFLISFGRIQTISKVMKMGLPSVQEVITVSELRRRGMSQRFEDIESSDIFFLQYTSGSTGDPKGVTLQHTNVLANIQGIGWGVKVKPDDAVVSWLPLYHDMGLIGSWLFSVYYGLPITILSPLDFLARPERWLWAINDTNREVLCPAPNFSYELCTRKISDEAMQDVDLSRWRVVINAGEAVLPETLARFEERFRPYGFDAKGFIPCYGLAESSVALTFPPLWRKPLIDTVDRTLFERDGVAKPEKGGRNRADVIRFVANGRPIPGHEVRIVDEQDRDVAERVRGRILFRGPSNTSGYYCNPEATKAVTNKDGWMDTGDVGYSADAEIYITGRLKETIIKGGHNITPHEIELAAAEVRGVRRGCVAAFGVTDHDTGTERLVVVAEIRSGHGNELDRIRNQLDSIVNERIGTPPDHVELVAPQVIPKTSSGKIRRNQTRLLYEQKCLKKSTSPPWVQMLRIWARHTGDFWRIFGASFGTYSIWVVRHTLIFGTAGLVGLLARLAPTHNMVSLVVRVGARLVIRLAGETTSSCIYGQDRKGSVLYVANRVSQSDVLVLVASLPEVIFLANHKEFEDLPIGVAFMLEPLIITEVDEAYVPPGGNLQQKVFQALSKGFSVVVCAENRFTWRVQRNRYRLEPLVAATMVKAHLVPVRLTSTEKSISGNPRLFDPVEVTLGDPLVLDGDGLEYAASLREGVRDAIATL